MGYCQHIFQIVVEQAVGLFGPSVAIYRDSIFKIIRSNVFELTYFGVTSNGAFFSAIAFNLFLLMEVLLVFWSIKKLPLISSCSDPNEWIVRSLSRWSMLWPL